MAEHREPERLEAILALLRRRGGRLTPTRRAIVSALVAAGDHLTADDITDTVRRAHPDLALTTVYRCLETLEELGVVEHVHLGHGRAAYHLASEDHQHLVCEACGTVVEVPTRLFDDLAATLDAGYGFSIRPHHFAVPGRCSACRKAGASL